MTASKLIINGEEQSIGWEWTTKFYINSDYSNIASIWQDVASWLNNTSQDPTVSSYMDATVFVWDMPYYRVWNAIADSDNYVVTFYEDNTNVQNSPKQTRTYRREVRFTFSYTNGVWAYVSEAHSYIQIFTPYILRTDYDYTTPYTPLYNGSPATKKYVDDKITTASGSPFVPSIWMLWYDTTNKMLRAYDWSSGGRRSAGVSFRSSTPSNPVEWMIWYDSTNKTLKFYDWTNWKTVTAS